MSQLDEQLDAMRQAHRATARYTVYYRPANFSKDLKSVATGLTWDEANKKRDELTATLGPRRFGDPMYGIELEKPAVAA